MPPRRRAGAGGGLRVAGRVGRLALPANHTLGRREAHERRSAPGRVVGGAARLRWRRGGSGWLTAARGVESPVGGHRVLPALGRVFRRPIPVRGERVYGLTRTLQWTGGHDCRSHVESRSWPPATELAVRQQDGQ